MRKYTLFLSKDILYFSKWEKLENHDPLDEWLPSVIIELFNKHLTTGKENALYFRDQVAFCHQTLEMIRQTNHSDNLSRRLNLFRRRNLHALNSAIRIGTCRMGHLNRALGLSRVPPAVGEERTDRHFYSFSLSHFVRWRRHV